MTCVTCVIRSAILVAVLGSSPVLGGCGSVHSIVAVNAAQARLEQARQMGAETKAPFEYYYAKEHLRQAQVEASDASYGDAATFAQTAETYAQKAIDRIQAGPSEGAAQTRAGRAGASDGASK